MSEVRLVRCPKCSKVLQEPHQYAVYQCGACGVFLKAKGSISVDGNSDKLVNCDKEGTFYMADRSPARSVTGDDVVVDSDMKNDHLGDLDSDHSPPVRSSRVSRSPMREIGYGDFGYDGVGDDSLTRLRNKGVVTPMNVRSIDVTKSPLREERALVECDESLPKSPMRDRFLNDLGSIPNSAMRSRGGSRSSSDFDFGGVEESEVRPRTVSKSPLREKGASSGMSVRTRDVTRSPFREARAYKSPARSVNEDFLESPTRGDNFSESRKNKNVEIKQYGSMGDHFGVEEEEVCDRKMEQKTSFSSWVYGDQYMAEPDRRRTWRDRVDKVDQISEGRESVYSVERSGTPQTSVDTFIHVIESSKEKVQQDMRFGGDYVADFSKSRRTRGPWVPRKDGVAVSERMLASSSSADGYLNYPPEYIDGYGYSRHSFDSPRGAASNQGLELEHAELLRKYKELKNQLSDLEGGRFSPAGYYRGSGDHSTNEAWRFQHESAQQYMLDTNVRRPQHFNYGPSHVPHLEDKYNFAPYGYSNPFSGQVTRAPRPNRPHQVLQRCDEDSMDLYDDKTHYHHPSCTCSLCYVSDWHDQDEAGSLASGTSTNFASVHRSTRSLDIERPGPRAYNPRMAQTTPQKRPSYLAQHHQKRFPVANQEKRICYPVSGGAPFVLCKECFRLLKLPKKLMSVQTIQHQLQCGACSAVMSFDFQNSSSIVPSEIKSDTIGASNGLDEVPKDSGLKHHRNSDAATSTNFGSYDFDSIGCGFQSNYETCEVSKDKTSGISVADTECLSPSSPRSSRDHISDSASVHSSQSNTAEMSLKNTLIRPPPGSPLQEHFEYSTILRKNEVQEVSGYTVEDKQIAEKDTSSGSSAETTMVTTEIDVPSSEVPPKILSHDSLDVPREDDKVGNNKDKKSSVPTFMKWGFANLGSQGRAEVSVNGQALQPHLVKRAEKLAGPIHPGDYWYDSKAGFWGAMGHRCLGIIPPFIQEFNFPIPKNCSGGDTAVCVNGRELHQRDLNLLASRGLPITGNKSYIIDISGKVLDEETKEFVANLGKLAPTVEKKRRGFGMQVPQENLED